MNKILLLLLMLIAFNASATTPEQYQQQIQQAYLNGNYSKYFELACQYFSEYQTIDGLLQIAEAYSSGEGVKQDSQKAAECYNGIVASLEQMSSLDEGMKALLGYSYRMYGINEMTKYGLDHIFNRNDLQPFYMGADKGDAFCMYIIGHSYLSGDYKAISESEAIDFLKRAADKNCIMALSDLGGYYDRKGDADKALKFYMKGADTNLFNSYENADDPIAVLINPNNVRNQWVVECHESCIFNVGHSFYSIEEEEEALKWLEKLSVDVPKHLNLRAQCYLIVGDKEKCMRDLKRSVQIEPDSKTYDFMGIVCAYFGDIPEAENYFDIAIAMGNSSAKEHKEEYLKR